MVSATGWTNHAPKDIFHFNELAEVFSTSKFVLSIRDPRNFTLSYRFKWFAMSNENVDRIKALYNPIITALLRRASAKRILNRMNILTDTRGTIFCWEDLIQSLKEIGRRLYAFIGEKFRSEYLNVEFSNSSHGLSNSGVSSASVGRWIDKLSEDEVWWGTHHSAGTRCFRLRKLQRQHRSPDAPDGRYTGTDRLTSCASRKSAANRTIVAVSGPPPCQPGRPLTGP